MQSPRNRNPVYIGSNMNSQSNILSNPQSNIRQNPQSNILSNPQSNIRQNPQSNILSNPQSNILSNPQSNILSNPQSNIRQNPQPQSNSRTVIDNNSQFALNVGAARITGGKAVVNQPQPPKDLWEQLHKRALEFPNLGLKNDLDFIRKWSLNIPSSGGCRCKSSWSIWYRENPPDFNNYFEWTVKAHNATNDKLGKPSYTVEEARKFYSNP